MELNQTQTLCIWFADRGCNHTSIYAMYSEKDKLATLVGAGKWSTQYVSSALLSEDASDLSIRAKTVNLMPILENDLTVELDRSENSNKAYRRDRDSLVVTASSQFRICSSSQNFLCDVCVGCGDVWSAQRRL